MDVTKITSVEGRTYTVALAKKITGTSMADVEQKGKAWFVSAEGQADSKALDQIGVDPSWEQYFAQKAK